MTQEQLRDGLLGIGAPGLLGAMGALVGFWVSSILARRDEPSRLAGRLERLGPALGFGLAYVLVLWAIQGLPPSVKSTSWSGFTGIVSIGNETGDGRSSFLFLSFGKLPPIIDLSTYSVSHFQIVLVILGCFAVCIEAILQSEKRQKLVRWLGRTLLIVSVLWFQFSSARKHQWDASVETIAWTAGFGLWMVLAFGAMDLLQRKASAAPSGFSMGAIPLFALPAIFDSGATAQWQIALGVAMALIGMAVVGLVLRGRSLGSPVATVFVLWLCGMIVVGHIYSDMPLWHAGVLASMPFLLLVPELRPKLGWKAKLGVRLALVAIAGGAISFKAAPTFVKTFTGGGATELDFYR